MGELLIHPTRSRSWRPEVKARVEAWIKEREAAVGAAALKETQGASSPHCRESTTMPRSRRNAEGRGEDGPTLSHRYRQQSVSSPARPYSVFPLWFWPVVAPLLLWAGWEVIR